MMGSSNPRISEKWLKAAVLGSVWAAFEIIAGSFLHNIRLPFAGTMLSMFSVFMLVAFMRHWKEPGVIFRAGIVAALMKSISPSAVIFGPMIAIAMEAIILETITFILGRHLFSFMLAGALAVTWALFQKVLNFLIIYGFDLVKVAEAFYHWAVIKTGLEQVTPSLLILIIAGSYGTAGIMAAVMGYLTYSKSNGREINSQELPARKRSGYLQATPFRNYNALHILLIIVVIGGILYLVEYGPVWSFLIPGLLFTGYIIWRYRGSVRYIRKPRVWIQFTLFALLATLLWEWITTGQYFSLDGLEIGLKMIFRAVLIIFGFAALSVELRNPLIRSILNRNGLSSLYVSLNLAFTALPYIVDRLPGFRTMVRERKRLIGSLINQADQLLERFEKESMPRKNVYILTGNTQSGKTTLLEKTVTMLRKKGVNVHGILAPGNFRNGRRNEIYNLDLASGDKLLATSRDSQEGWTEYRGFYFNPEAFKRGEKIINHAISENASLIILDEVGPLEMRGKGWYPIMETLREQRETRQLWVVREKLLKEVKLNYMIPDGNVIYADRCSPGELTEVLSLA